MRKSRADAEKKRIWRLDDSPPKPRRRSSPARSPARSRPKSSPSRKSPNRKSPNQKSPNRKSPNRKSPNRKSPAKKPPARKSPARKSPSRASKDAEVSPVPRSPGRRQPIKMETSEITISKSGLRGQIGEFGMRDISIDLHELRMPITGAGDSQNGYGNAARVGLRGRKSRNTEDSLPSRRSSRLQDTLETLNDILSLPQTNITKTANVVFSEDLSEDEDIKLLLRRSKNRNLLTPVNDDSFAKSKKSQLFYEFGGRWGAALLIIFMPVILFFGNIFCNKNQCSFVSLPDLSPYYLLDTWFSFLSLKIWLSYTSLVILMAKLPLGERVAVPETQIVYRKNVMLLFASLFLLTGIASYYDIKLYRIVYEEYFRLMVTSLISALLFSIFLYAKSMRVPHDQRNAYGNSGNFTYDFWMGRESKLSIGGIYVKSIFIRMALTSAIFYNVSYLILGLHSNEPIPTTVELADWSKFVHATSISPTLATFALTQILYVASLLLTEHNLKHGFEMQEEGLGYMMTVGYFTFPFLFTLVTKYVLEHKVAYPVYVLAAIWSTVLFGTYLFVASNRIKHIFRTNTLDPRVSQLESMPTFHGKRLLVSGWWAFVRHPNYLGDALVHSAWLLAWPASLQALLTILLLVGRVKRVETRCERRYEAAWRRYVAKVPYGIIPHVY